MKFSCSLSEWEGHYSQKQLPILQSLIPVRNWSPVNILINIDNIFLALLLTKLGLVRKSIRIKIETA